MCFVMNWDWEYDQPRYVPVRVLIFIHLLVMKIRKTSF